MNHIGSVIAIALVVASASVVGYSETPGPLSAVYVGRWDVILKDSNKSYPSWLEISEVNGQLKVRMVGRWGHARYLSKVEIFPHGITFMSPKEEEGGQETDMVFEGKLVGKTLVGTVSGPDLAKWTWTARRAPSLKRKGVPKWGEPIQLFNGKDLSGWTFSDPASKKPWTVEDGILRSPGHGPEIITQAKFEDFKLHIEFNCGHGANSGIYLRGRYEVQIEDDPHPEAFSQRTGGVYGFVAPSPEAPRKPGEWQTYDITLAGRMVTVDLNGKTIIDNQEIPGITGGALDTQEELPGPIYLQGSEDGQVEYRNIVITLAE